MAGDPLKEKGDLPSKFGVIKGSRIGVTNGSRKLMGFWMTKKMLDFYWTHGTPHPIK